MVENIVFILQATEMFQKGVLKYHYWPLKGKKINISSLRFLFFNHQKIPFYFNQLTEKSKQNDPQAQP